jgi:hypothetical protein
VERVGKAHVVLPNLAGMTWNNILVKLGETEKHAAYAAH